MCARRTEVEAVGAAGARAPRARTRLPIGPRRRCDHVLGRQRGGLDAVDRQDAVAAGEAGRGGRRIRHDLAMRTAAPSLSSVTPMPPKPSRDVAPFGRELGRRRSGKSGRAASMLPSITVVSRPSSGSRRDRGRALARRSRGPARSARPSLLVVARSGRRQIDGSTGHDAATTSAARRVDRQGRIDARRDCAGRPARAPSGCTGSI